MNPSLDIAATVSCLEPEHKLRSESRHYYPGGGGINVARVIKRCGELAQAVFPADRAIGRKLIELLEDEGVPYHDVAIEAEVRENFLVHVEKEEALYHFVMPGARLTGEEAQRCLDALGELRPAPRYLVASGSLPPGVGEDFYARVAHTARRHDMRVILDTSGPPLTAALEEGVYLVKPNRREFAELAGEEPAEDEAERREQIREVVQRGSMEVLVLTLGEHGAILATPERQIHARPPRVKTVSPVGAGDSFVALLTLKLAEERSLTDALCFGVAAAAAAVQTRAAELCAKADVDRIHRQMQENEESVRIHETENGRKS